MKDTYIGTNPPNDGREWDCQCARCGSSMSLEGCDECGGQGITDYGELHALDPLMYDVKDVAYCLACHGDSTWYVCLSSPEWCEANPIIGREGIARNTPEWFVLPERKRA